MKLVHVIKTASYLSDGRLLKWIESLKLENINSSVFLVQDKNNSGLYTVDNVKIHEERLWIRRIFRKSSGLIFKSIELCYKWQKFYRHSNADLFIFHDVQQYLNIFVSLFFLKRRKKCKLVWDLHEIPHVELASNLFMRSWIRYLLSKADLLVYTNEERRKYILDKFGHTEKNYVVLNNFPDFQFIHAPRSPMSEDLSTWVKSQGGKPYLLWMGAASKGRYFDVVFQAYQKFKDRFNLVIMGKIEANLRSEIDEYIEKGNIFNRFVSQAEILGYVDNAHFSIVLYNADKPNNKFCEPNRLFQLLTRNIPVITGNNPTMKSWMGKLGGGIVLPDDGRNPVVLEQAITTLLEQHESYENNLRKIDKEKTFDWNAQFKGVINFIHSK